MSHTCSRAASRAGSFHTSNHVRPISSSAATPANSAYAALTRTKRSSPVQVDHEGPRVVENHFEELRLLGPRVFHLQQPHWVGDVHQRAHPAAYPALRVVKRHRAAADPPPLARPRHHLRFEVRDRAVLHHGLVEGQFLAGQLPTLPKQAQAHACRVRYGGIEIGRLLHLELDPGRRVQALPMALCVFRHQDRHGQSFQNGVELRVRVRRLRGSHLRLGPRLLEPLFDVLEPRHVGQRHHHSVNAVIRRAVREGSHRVPPPLPPGHLFLDHRQVLHHRFHVGRKVRAGEVLRQMAHRAAHIRGDQVQQFLRGRGEAPNPQLLVQEERGDVRGAEEVDQVVVGRR